MEVMKKKIQNFSSIYKITPAMPKNTGTWGMDTTIVIPHD